MKVTLACPRCQGPMEGEFYGPCDVCRAELRLWSQTAIVLRNIFWGFRGAKAAA